MDVVLCRPSEIIIQPPLIPLASWANARSDRVLMISFERYPVGTYHHHGSSGRDKLPTSSWKPFDRKSLALASQLNRRRYHPVAGPNPARPSKRHSQHPKSATTIRLHGRPVLSRRDTHCQAADPLALHSNALGLRRGLPLEALQQLIEPAACQADEVYRRGCRADGGGGQTGGGACPRTLDIRNPERTIPLVLIPC